MKVSELREQLKNINGDYEVMVDDGEYAVKVKSIRVEELFKRVLLRKR